jgi:hypothetical protein
MGDGLSDAQRWRMARERERAERRMAEERERIQPRLARERERAERRMAEERERIQPRLARYHEDMALDAKHRERYGPKVVTGPDGVPVLLEVVTSGLVNWRDPPPFLRGPFGTRTVGRINDGAVRLLSRRGFVLRISAYGLHHRVFVRDEDAAAALFLRAAKEIEQEGLAGLRTWTPPGSQR